MSDYLEVMVEFDTQDHAERPGGDHANDPVNHPADHYLGGIEVMDAIEAWQLPYHLGNVVKYVARAAHKGDELTDLRKAQWYLDRHIRRLEQRERKLLEG